MKLILALSVLAALTATSANAADTLYSGGPIVTVDDRNPDAEAIVVRDGRIAFVGTRKAARRFSPQAQQIDLQGHTLTPGFIDAHGHVSGVGLQALSANLLPAPDGEGNSIPALQKIMREFRAHPTTPEGYKVLIGFGYDDSQLVEQRHPTRQDLDAIATDIPIILMHQSGHLGAYNSKALEMAGITADTPNPPGGVIRREPGSNVPDGVLEESAHNIALAKLMPAMTAEQSLAMLEAG